MRKIAGKQRQRSRANKVRKIATAARFYRGGVWGRRSRAQLAPTQEVFDYTARLRKIASGKKYPSKTLAPTQEVLDYNGGNPVTISTVLRLMVMMLAMRSTM